MLIKKDLTSKGQSRFTCDRCKIDLTTNTRRGIYVQHDKRSPIKKWDLCLSCYGKLKRGIEKGVSKR